jgi:hypothetical protein
MSIKVEGNIVIKNNPVSDVSEDGNSITIENKIVQMEEGTVVHNGKPKKFNKKMSAYMIDMLTSEE